MFTDVFGNLLQYRSISTYRLTKDTGIPNGMVNKWKNGVQLPGAENLVKLADYFDVSVDYLLGRTDNPEVNK